MKKLLVLIFIGLSIINISCNKNKKTEEDKIVFSEDMAKIVSQVTNGNIHNNDVITVHFVNNIVNKNELNKNLDNDVFEFTPSIKGKTFWENENTLIFKPEKSFQYRKTYEGKLNIIKLSDNLKDKINEALKFSFTIIGREIATFTGDLKLKNRNNPKILTYCGKISFTEDTKLDDIKEAISLKKGSKNINLTWIKETDNRSFSFRSENLIRANKTDNYNFNVEKNKLNLSDDLDETFKISPLEQMKVTRIIKKEEGRNPKVRIEFSDEFDSKQNINGLITIEPKLDVKIQKLGNSLILDADFCYGNNYKIIVNEGIKSRWGTSTTGSYTKNIRFSDIKPQVEFASNGVFLPTTNNYKVQFYTSNLERVHIEVKKVYENSLAEFLRTEKVNSLNDRKTSFNGSYINRVGVIIHNETFEIGKRKNSWLLNEIDLSDIVKQNDKGLYLIRLNFNPRDMLVNIDNEYKYIEEHGQVYKPVFFSNIGLTCKKTNNKVIVFATDLTTCKPISNVNVRLRKSYSNNKIISSAVTNSDGKAELAFRHFYNTYIEAEKDGQRSVIKFNEMQWNISGFDIGGIDEYKPGTKAFLYTERGVYRPGDEINISVIARHSNNKFPNNHPLTLELINPQGKKVYTVNSTKNTNGFYNFKINTKQSDPTGNWNAQINIGNKYFNHRIKIETIVPYRLKVKLVPENKTISWDTDILKFNIESKYLFGNPAANLPAEVDLEITERTKSFPEYSNFVFRNPTLDFKDIQKKIFTGNLDEKGIKTIEWMLPSLTGVPSSLNIKLTGKVIEKGGRPNINWKNIPIETYSHYVGIQPPKYYYVATGNDVEIPTILVNAKGEPTSGKTLKYRIYRNTEYWWWQYDNSKKLRFKTDNNTILVKEGTITTKKTHSNIKFLPIEKGNYFIEVTDESGTGHSSGIFFRAYPYGGIPAGDKNAGTLSLNSDKKKYNVGDEATIQFPTPKEGLVLVCIEKENKILKSMWVYPEKEGEQNIKIPITKEMVPNAYVSVSLIQPHSQTLNDRPIRMFGILPLLVEDKDTRHYFDIKTKSSFRPKKPFEVEVQTQDNKQTQFTIAVVDEGLLDITQFKTPNPWKYFFRKTRLKVNTYDLFSQVISANKGDVFKTFSIGGDMDYRESQEKPDKGKRRFKPVSIFKGPITTDNSGKAIVKFNMPNYVGSVRIMIIGAKENSYAKAEKTVPVKSELMLLPTLPKVIGPMEKFTVPITVFAMKDNIGKVSIKIKTEGPVKVEGNNTRSLNFTDKNDKDCFFNLQTPAKVGQSKITITAKSANYSASYIVDLMVRPSSPRVYSSLDNTITPGEKKSITIPKDGIDGTNRAELSISNFPVVNFNHRLKWLISYPYGCIEQTTSAVFPQLYLKKFIKYPDANAERIDNNINRGIEKLRRFQQFSGGFSYWPYGSDISEWGTLYAGHFMIEAKKLGYYVNDDLYQNWLRYTKRQARNNKNDVMFRVYRTYILALSGNSSISEMNLLRENKLSSMNNTQKWLLAASYELSGLSDKAETIIKNAGIETKNYQEFANTYGSGLRDKAMILDALVILKKEFLADKLVKEIGSAISARNWYSTQTVGYSILAMGKYMDYLNTGSETTKIKGRIIMPDGTEKAFDSNKTFSMKIDKGFGKNMQIIVDKETTVKKVYVTLASDGVPLQSSIITESKNLSLNVNWYNEDGTSIDISELKQGTTFWGHFHVKNISTLKSIEEIALVQILPSGWEIENTRLLNQSMPTWTKSFKLDYEEYLDIRDDRIMWFFDLHDRNKTKHELDFMVKLNAISVGEFTLPPSLVEAMYNGNYKATKKGQKVKVIKP